MSYFEKKVVKMCHKQLSESFSENVQLHRKNVLFVMLINIETAERFYANHPLDSRKHSGPFHMIEDILQRAGEQD